MLGVSSWAWLLPLISACMWLAMLLAMLITWLTEGHPIYSSFGQGQRIAYISDIGAEGLKPLFITGCIITVVLLDLAFIAERWLRHEWRLVPNSTQFEKAASSVSIFASILGAAGLILLSIFDTLRHHRVHDAMLAVFIVGYIASAIFICAEYQRLGAHFRQHILIRVSFWIKLVFILVELALAIAFGVTQQTGHLNVAAVLEWVISLIFFFYILTFMMDLAPAVHIKHKRSTDPEKMQTTGTAEAPYANDNISSDRYASRSGPGQYPGDPSYPHSATTDPSVSNPTALESGYTQAYQTATPSRNF